MPRRWIVGRTLAWLARYCRHSKNCKKCYLKRSGDLPDGVARYLVHRDDLVVLP